MPQRIEVPGHGIVEFPDGMTDDQIAAAIRANSAPQATAGDSFRRGLADQWTGAAQLLTKALPDSVVSAGNRANNWLADKTGLVGRLPEGGLDQQIRQEEQAYQSARGNDGIDWWRAAGNMASPANLLLAAKIPQAATLGGRIGLGALAGGGSAALTPVAGEDFAREKATQVATGAVAGGAVPAVAGGLARMVRPNASVNPDLALLKGEGVRPTIGQALGGRWNALEEKATSVPIVGDAIANARRNSIEQFNRAAIGRVTAPIGGKVDDIGQTGVAKAGDAASDAYEAAKARIQAVKFDQQFATDLAQLKSMAQNLVPEMRNRFNRELRDTLGGRTSPANAMGAETFKRVDSELGVKAARYQASSVASEKELGDALAQMQALLRQQAARNDPQAAQMFKAADEAWANLVRVEGAAKAAKNSGGVFTPAQLNTAIQTADKSTRKRAVSRGTALMQDLGNAGQQVLGNKVPNSFTTDRALVAGGGLGAYFIDPLIPAGLLTGAGLYSPQVQSLLVGLASNRGSGQLAGALADAIRKGSPALIPAAGQVGLGLLNQ